MEQLKNEYEYLVHLIKCALQDIQPFEKPPQLSFEKVYEYGKAHEVANIAFVSVQRLNMKPDADLYSRWKTAYAFSLQRHANQMDARKKIVDALDSASIRHVEVQGTVMKTLYPYPEWRMMSDIDFIIDKENLEKAELIIKDLGYKTKNSNGVEFSARGANNIVVEIHSDYFVTGTIYCDALTDAFSSSVQIDNTYSYRADDTAFYLYSILHCIKHYMHSGAGIRRMTDMYILREKLSAKIDEEYVSEVLSKNGFGGVVDEIFSVVDKWFCGVTPNGASSKAEEDIYKSNNHGTALMQIKKEYIKANSKEKRFFKLRKYVYLFFPSKERVYTSFPECEKRRLPLVACWVYRWFNVLSNAKKRKQAKRLLSNIRNTKIK